MQALRRHRRWISGCMVGFLLFMLGAVAAIACPQVGNGDAGSSMHAMADMPDCAGDIAPMEPVPQPLCKAHCESDRQSVNKTAVMTDVSPLPLAGALVGIVVDAADTGITAAAMRAALLIGPPAGDPALYLSLLVLRN
ncbi:MAG: hypothetical protein IT499_03800 [Rubrivivax sp.]|nr:hypothetical protein [Rubrivivax sp.]MCL4698554.1 hypothetical protein [Burkholderiaceae bacterium]